ncbi:hypothetical protein EFA69_17905 [Rufibacter immobilis]|uniref:Macroglobulin domain-containing protein n=1 Tax=Rufibacter immobilis TaxID=1348778 RepID=A0A3M9MR31_9BACT|nr:hypothetical protein [Rufibacter immobilis]RNI27961.1 hypothetical protein EFA69_17905 [Rufibacter immobilis]
MGQNTLHQDIEEQFNQFQPKVLHEKLFLHTDQEYYLAGETLWFKVYYVEGTTHRPLALSKIAYVEVLDRNKQPVLQAKVGLTGGMGKGALELPLSLGSDHYTIRAYTLWMKNFSPDFFFEKKITLVNTIYEAGQEEAKVENGLRYDIQFFPEGGNLVMGLQSKVAVRAVGPEGKGISFKGAIVNQKNDTVAKFQPLKFGIGTFFFTPLTGQYYRAVIFPAKGRPVVTEIPAIHDQGFTMQVQEIGQGQLRVTIHSSQKDNQEPVYLFAHTRQIAKVAKGSSMVNGHAIFTIDKDQLGDGISNLTFFNQNQKPLCERLYFKKPENTLVLEAATTKSKYTSRSKVELDISTLLSKGIPAEANLSVSVFHLDSLQTPAQGNLLSYLFLTSELKGEIEAPSYYLSNNTPEAAIAVDNLMLTHGWRRFNWEDVMQNNLPIIRYAPEFDGLTIAGTLKADNNGAAAKGIPVFLAVPDTLPQFYGGISNKRGEVQFNVHPFYGKREIVWQTATPNYKSESAPELQNPYATAYSTWKLPIFAFPVKRQESLLGHSIHAQVQALHYTPSFAASKPVSVDALPFYGTPDKKYVLKEYTPFPTLEDSFKEYMPEVLVRKADQKNHLYVADARRQTYFENEPLLLVDGLPIFNAGKITAMSSALVKRIEVVNKKYMMGDFTFFGILSIRTYKGNLNGVELDPNVFIFDFEGLQQQREFFAPRYEGQQQQIASRKPDFRNLLYWATDLTTNNNGKGALSFYTSDKKGKYLGVIQGITKEGVAGSQTFTFEVTDTL